MKRKIVINIISVLAQLLASFEIGNLTANALFYTTTRGQAFRDGFVILGCIIVLFVIDKMFREDLKLPTRKSAINELDDSDENNSSENDSNENDGFSPIILDIVAFTLGTIVIASILGMYGSNTISVTLVTMLIAFVLLVIRDVNIYMGVDAPVYDENLVDDYIDDEKTNDGDSDNNDDEVDGAKNTNEIDGVSIDEVLEEAEQIINEMEETSVEVEEEVDEDRERDEEGVRKEYRLSNRILAQVAYVLSGIAFMIFGVLALGDVWSQKFGGLYYLLIFLVAALTVLFRFIHRAFASMTDNEVDLRFAGFGTKDEMIGVIVLSVIIALFLGHRSILLGFVYLLSVAVVRVIIPTIFENWGTGGTNVVNKNKFVCSRLASRVFGLIMIMIAVWLLSYGAVWEIEYQTIIATAITCKTNR
ncbi:MAG: hypothetical protein K6F60_06115 [Eubacterium sp.]|nr:hypothetical protein [Eubacterium sp.]